MNQNIIESQSAVATSLASGSPAKKKGENVDSTSESSPVPASRTRLCAQSSTIPSPQQPMLSPSPTAPSNKYQCDQCGKFFGKPSKLLSHKKSVHENARPFECKQCGDTFKRKDHLTRHEVSRHAVNRHLIPCPTFETTGCLMSFPNKDQVRKHVFRTHEKKIMCEKCVDKDGQPLIFQKKS